MIDPSAPGASEAPGSSRPFGDRLVELSARRLAALARALDAAWSRGLRHGIVAYDPAATPPVSLPPYRFHYLPGRATRPGAGRAAPPPLEGLRLPHEPCPFDGPDFVSLRGIASFGRGGRTYHLTCNRYPVTARHFLLVRDGKAAAGALPQYIQGPEELEDLLLFLAMVGPPYRVYFNSNRGADGSQSGSSVNHWHFQTFPLQGHRLPPLQRLEHETVDERDGVSVRRAAAWPARHVVLEASKGRLEALAHQLWSRFRRLNALNVAYNLEVVEVEDAGLRAYLFPRRPAPDLEIPGAGSWSANFGGWELSGDIVVPTSGILEWLRAHGRDAVRLTDARLRDTTFALDEAG